MFSRFLIALNEALSYRLSRCCCQKYGTYLEARPANEAQKITLLLLYTASMEKVRGLCL
jgi:hypothetical protein